MNAVEKYKELRHGARRLADGGGYNLSVGEMNPVVYQQFAELLADEGASLAWEPFANPDGRTFSSFGEAGLRLVAHSLVEGHPEIVEADSTIVGPDGDVDGVLFHPPYFGSAPFSEDVRDLSLAQDEDEWLVLIESAVDVALEHLNTDGVVCAVGRRYRHGGKEIRLDERLVEAFCGPLVPTEVWSAEPDVVIIMRWSS